MTKAGLISKMKNIAVPIYVFYTQLRHVAQYALRMPISAELEEIPCNVCKSKNTRFLFSKRDKKKYSNLRQAISMDVVQCIECGFVYVNPRYREDVLKDIYSNDLFETYKYEKNHKTRINVLYDAYHDKLEERIGYFHGYLDVIRAHVPKGRLLDVGTCFGYFLKVARERGYDVCGIEVSKQCVDFARNELGLPSVELGGIGDVSFENCSFDAITSWHVIEHLHDPAMFVRKADSMLRPGGFLFVTCPIFERVGFRDIQPTEHLSYFTPKTLKQLVSGNFHGSCLAESPIFVFQKSKSQMV